jgi:flagellar motor switch protein FliN/FliY
VNPDETTRVNPVITTWSSALQQTLSQLSGKQITVDAGPAEPSSPALWLRGFFEGELAGELALGLSRQSAHDLAGLFLGKPWQGDDAGLNEVLLEFLRQVNGHAVTALGAEGHQVQVRIETSQAPDWTDGLSVALNCRGESLSVTLTLNLSPALCQSVMSQPATVRPQPLRPSPPTNTSNGLDRLLDVELAASLRFGSRSMLLKEILELDAGAVIELDQRVQDPVELLLDGRVVLRGEVVIVDGNFGLRVSDVIQPCHAGAQA